MPNTIRICLVLAASILGVNHRNPVMAQDAEAAAWPEVYRTGFEDGADDWKPTDASAWKVAPSGDGHVYSQFKKQSDYQPPHRSPFNISLLDAPEVGDFMLDVNVKSTHPDYGHRDACLVFGYQDPSHFYYVHLGKETDDHANQIFIVNDKPRTKVSTKTTDGTPWDDAWHHVRIVRKAKAGTIAVFFDDMETPAMTATDKTFLSGRIGLGSFDDTSAWDDLVLRGEEIAGDAERRQSAAPSPARRPKIAAVVTAYHHNSHADVLVSRLLQTDSLDGQGRKPELDLVSIYTDQVPATDISRRLSKEHSVPIFDTVAGALTLGTGELAVDGVLLIAEHGDYPESATGQIIYPKRRLFGEILEVFESSGRVTPVFCDKHLADNWADAKWLYDEARRLDIPLMAGSSLPVLWREPAIDIERGQAIKEMVGVSYHRLDAYGFHSLEMAQCLAERRGKGESGVARVRCLTGEEVWKALDRGDYSRDLLELSLSRLSTTPTLTIGDLKARVPEPVAFVIDYRDGLRTTILTLNNVVGEWSIAWEVEGGHSAATRFATQEARPFHHFAHLLSGIERMMHSNKPIWPVERTLLTSGMLDALLISKQKGGEVVETPELEIVYGTDWNWRQPPPPPTDRPIDGQ